MPAAQLLERLTSIVLCACLAGSPPGLADNSPQSPGTVARVLGMDISEARIGGEPTLEARARALAGIIHTLASQEFSRGLGLSASSSAVEEVLRYNAAFASHDRDQRKRKLAQLDARLRSGISDPQDRERTESFRAALARIAADDAAADTRIAPGHDDRLRDEAVAAVQAWVVIPALQDRYGGIVGQGPWGQYPHGAFARLFRDLEQRGEIKIYDATLRTHFWRIVDSPPRFAVDPQNIDFTPFWRRPIPASYVD